MLIIVKVCYSCTQNYGKEIHLVDCPLFNRGDTFCHFLFPEHNAHTHKGSTLKGLKLFSTGTIAFFF